MHARRGTASAARCTRMLLLHMLVSASCNRNDRHAQLHLGAQALLLGEQLQPLLLVLGWGHMPQGRPFVQLSQAPCHIAPFRPLALQHSLQVDGLRTRSRPLHQLADMLCSVRDVAWRADGKHVGL